MKTLHLIVSILISTSCFAQYEQTIGLNNGFIFPKIVTEIDSITFNTEGSPTMQLNLINGESDTYALDFIAQVTFSEYDPYPQGSVHCPPDSAAVVEVLNPATGRIWMDRNLGASQEATSIDDPEAYGDLYQWGRFSDGHQCRNSPTTFSGINNESQGHGSFVVTVEWPYYWGPYNAFYWNGLTGFNNPCPDNFRIPTEAEWEEERLSWTEGNNAAGAFNSPLKLVPTGYRLNTTGGLHEVGFTGYYWSSTISGFQPFALVVTNSGSNSEMLVFQHSFGLSVRCIKH